MFCAVDVPSTYHEEGWLYDVRQVVGPLIGVALAVACFAVTVVMYEHPSRTLGTGVAGAGGAASVTATPSAAVGGLFTLLTVVVSLLAIGAGVYVALDTSHRVRKLAYASAALSAANLVGFAAFAIATA